MSALPPAEIEDLKEFVRHIRTLADTRFAKAVLSKETITLRSTTAWQASEIVNFDEEDCRSFLLGCRLLLQNNDRVSIGRIWKIFKDRIKNDAWFIRINPPRWMLNDFLDQRTMFATPHDAVTNRELLDTFLYGSYAHLEARHRTRFREWEGHKQYPFLKLSFLAVLQVLFKCAVDMAQIVSDWLAENEAT
jgi:hypothetical protein